jgi:lysophospholipase L1-like esterase
MTSIQICCLVLSSLCVSFALAELAARFYLARFGRYFVWQRHARSRRELDRGVLPTLDPTVRFDINEIGERGDPVPRDLSRVYRVLVAGGSATECYYIDQKSTWPAVVQRVLNEDRNLQQLGVERVHVGNISRSLASAAHLCRIFEHVMPRYEKLDAIVLLVGGSDVIRWLERGAPNTVEDEPIPASDVFAEHPEGPFGWRLKSLALWRIAKHWDMRLRAPIDVRRGVGQRLAKCRAMRGRAKVILEDLPFPRSMLGHYEKNLRRLIELARTRAERVILVRQPWFDKEFTPEEEGLMWNFGAGNPSSGELSTYYSHAVVRKLLWLVNARTARVAKSLGLEEIDLMPALDCSVEIYYDELHHTPKGCQVIGDEVAGRILRKSRQLEAVPSVIRARPEGVIGSEKQPA